MAFLLRAPNALRMRTALLAHRDLVNQDLLNAANAAPIALGRSPPGKELCPAMYLIPRVTDDRKEIVKGVLMWGSFCRAHLAMWNAERHFRRAKELAKGLADPGIHLMIISAQAGLCRDV